MEADAAIRHAQGIIHCSITTDSQSTDCSQNVCNVYTQSTTTESLPFDSTLKSSSLEGVADDDTFISCQISIKNEDLKVIQQKHDITEMANKADSTSSITNCNIKAITCQKTPTSLKWDSKKVESSSHNETGTTKETHQSRDQRKLKSHSYQDYTKFNRSRSSSWERKNESKSFYTERREHSYRQGRRHSTTSSSSSERRHRYSRNNDIYSTSKKERSPFNKSHSDIRYDHDVRQKHHKQEYGRSRSPHRISQNNDCQHVDGSPSALKNHGNNLAKEVSDDEVMIVEDMTRNSGKIQHCNSNCHPSPNLSVVQEEPVQLKDDKFELPPKNLSMSNEHPKTFQEDDEKYIKEHHQDEFDIIPLLTKDCGVVENPNEFYFPPLSEEKCSEKQSRADTDFSIYPKRNETCDQTYDDRREVSKYIDSFDIVGKCQSTQNFETNVKTNTFTYKTVDSPGYFTTEQVNKNCDVMGYIPVHITAPTEDLTTQELFPSYKDSESVVSDDDSNDSNSAISVIGTYTGSCLQDDFSTTSVSSTSESSESSSESSEFDILPLSKLTETSNQSNFDDSMNIHQNSKFLSPENIESKHIKNQALIYPCLAKGAASTIFKKIDLTLGSITPNEETNDEKVELKPEHCLPNVTVSTTQLRRQYVLMWLKSCRHHFRVTQTSEGQCRFSRSMDCKTTRKETKPKFQPNSQQGTRKELSTSLSTSRRVTHVTPWQAEMTDDIEPQDKVTSTCKQVPFVLPCPLIPPQHSQLPKDNATKKCSAPKSNIFSHKKSKESPKKQNQYKKYTSSKINSSKSIGLQPSFINSDEIRDKLSKFKIPKLSSPKVNVKSMENTNSHEVVDSTHTQDVSDEYSGEVCNKGEENSQALLVIGVDNDSSNVSYNEAPKITEEGVLNPQLNEDYRLCASDARIEPTDTSTNETNKNDKTDMNEKQVQISEYISKCLEKNSNYINICNFFAFMNSENIPEHLLNKICLYLEINLQDFLNVNEEFKLLITNNEELENKYYNISTDTQKVLQEMIKNKGCIKDTLEMILAMLQNQLTDITLNPPYPEYLQEISKHLIQVWYHAFHYQFILNSNLQNICKIFDTQKQLHHYEILSNLTNFLLNFVDDNLSNCDLKMIIKLNCCKYDASKFDVNEIIIDIVVRETENEQIKTRALLLKMALYCENHKNLDSVLQLHNEIVTSTLTMQEYCAVKYFKAVALCNNDCSSEAVLILKEIIQESDRIDEILHRSTLVLLALISNDVEDVQVGLHVLSSYIHILNTELGILHPKTLTTCLMKATLMFKVPGYKAEALLNMWRVYTCQCEVLGEDHKLTCITKESIAMYAKRASNF